MSLHIPESLREEEPLFPPVRKGGSNLTSLC